MEKKLSILTAGIVIAFISVIPFLRAEDGGIKWQLYSMGVWRIRFHIPEGAAITQAAAGDWSTLRGVSDSGLEINGRLKRIWLPLHKIEEEVFGQLSLNRQEFELIDSGIRNRLEFRAYQTSAKGENKESMTLIFIGRHQRENLSYLLSLSSSTAFYDLHKDDFKFWYRNIYGF